MALELPAWLSASFPSREFKTFRRCKLRKDADPEVGAGLILEANKFGYHVESVLEQPGQDPLLEASDVIVGINGERLLFLQDELRESIFVSHFAAGAELLLITLEELREDQEMVPSELANYELLWRSKSETEQEATVRIPVGRATAWQLDEQMALNIQNDLKIVSEKFSLMAKPLISAKGMESIQLTGLPSAIAKARPEVVDILNWYRDEKPLAPKALVSVARPSTGPTEAMELPSHVKDLRQFQYHDHTADIIVHSWGSSMSEALAQLCVGMFNYMTPLDMVELTGCVEVTASGHDLLDLVYHLLDEFLYMFSTEMHICRCIEILSFDSEKFTVTARGYGEKMDLKKHEQGTEIKAITMHMMKVLDPSSMLTEDGKFERQKDDRMSDFPYEIYVLLDI